MAAFLKLEGGGCAFPEKESVSHLVELQGHVLHCFFPLQRIRPLALYQWHRVWFRLNCSSSHGVVGSPLRWFKGHVYIT
ncbi:hypothetical protein F2Q69_00019159 [Brassica cretica]|uniref:Uncharacterized protein n=1 Tax=Brassica cretica TaxID=69181 RepID=A0A8S9QSB0_BRACR|nr:hypothetical protein F2Q69_00019159 [Brassica cretica]